MSHVIDADRHSPIRRATMQSGGIFMTSNATAHQGCGPSQDEDDDW